MLEVERLSDEQLCGQLLVVGFSGSQLPADVQRRLTEQALGGIILFSRNLEGGLRSTWDITMSAKRAADPTFPIFVGIDQEGGRVRRLKKGVICMPSMRDIAQCDDLALDRKLATALAQQIHSLGINLNFSPVVDVDSNPNNPVIGDRAFSSDPKLVVRHAQVFMRCFQKQGVMACLKHFPGHGDSDTDSHTELPVVNKSLAELRRTELYPFERLAREVAAVMSAHVVFPSFDNVPATFSRRLLSLLRREFFFEGVLFSDDLEMQAVTKLMSTGEAAVAAVRAGCDALLICSDAKEQAAAHEALVDAVRKDDDFRQRCLLAVQTSLRVRRKYRSQPAGTWVEAQKALKSRTVAEARASLAARGIAAS